MKPCRFGCISSVYESLGNLDSKYLNSETCKQMLLRPRNSMELYNQELRLNIDDTEPTVFYGCEYCIFKGDPSGSLVSISKNINCCNICGADLTFVLKPCKSLLCSPLVSGSTQNATSGAGDDAWEGYVKETGESLFHPHPTPFSFIAKTKKSGGFRLISMAAQPKEAPANNPGLQETPDEATKGYFMQQTMFRIKDPKVSLDFYSRVLGMSLLKRLDFPEMKFSLYFLGYEDPATAPSNSVDRTVWTFSQKATIELTHNWGTESDPEFKGYHNGNSEPRGFGHIGITVDDTSKACERFERLGVEFVRKPDDGKMKGIAFIKDPDGYWIEIFDLKTIGNVIAGAA